MTKTQTVQQLLNLVNLELNLSSECLSLEIKGDFDSYEIIQRNLSFINHEGQVDYGVPNISSINIRFKQRTILCIFTI